MLFGACIGTTLFIQDVRCACMLAGIREDRNAIDYGSYTWMKGNLRRVYLETRKSDNGFVFQDGRIIIVLLMWVTSIDKRNVRSKCVSKPINKCTKRRTLLFPLECLELCSRILNSVRLNSPLIVWETTHKLLEQTKSYFSPLLQSVPQFTPVGPALN